MFISHMIGPAGRTAQQDQQREHAAERRIAQANASAREANGRAGGVSRESAMVAWLAGIYLPPIGPVARTPRQGRICRRRNTTADGLSWTSAAATWLGRAVNWMSNRRARTVVS
jgi:hypothetical protein